MFNVKKWIKNALIEILKDVQFEVEMKDGKPIYKAVIKKDF